MIAQLGQFLLCLALALSFWQILASWLSYLRAQPHLYSSAANAVVLQFLCVLGAFIALAYLMAAKDYSLPYVVAHTNNSLSLPYRVAATWSAHEGSMLMWLLMLSTSALISTRGARQMSLRFRAINLVALGVVSAGITAFVLFSSNPLSQSIPAMLDGRDLNPLLQDPGLIFHPPLLYVGYVGTVIVFAAAIAGLWCAELNRQWAVWLRPYALFSWIFLSLGIALGSYWAYYELGWGGWWFWDPVENASFMPWLLMTALVHALAASSRNGLFPGWCALLAIGAFALSLLGTFLVRSGILVSVHSFAADPQRGITILALLLLYLVPALIIFVVKAPARSFNSSFSWLSGESAILANNLLLSIGCATVFLGTLYPLALEVFIQERISVGVPYFNTVFIPIMVPLLILAATAGLMRWGLDEPKQLWARARIMVWIWLVITALLLVWALLDAGDHISLVLGASLALWVIIGTATSYVRRWHLARSAPAKTGATQTGLPLGVHGMHLAHLGLGVFVLAVVLVSALGISREISMRLGDSAQVGAYTFVLDEIGDEPGTNYDATVAVVSVLREGNKLTYLQPQRRRYHSQPDNQMTEAAIESMWFGDLFVALTGPVGDERWGMRIQIKPGIYWIWLSVLMMAGGGFLAMIGQLMARRRARP